MKIKCPSCNFEDDNVINWCFHVENHPYEALLNYFHLQEKIHEKIKSFENSEWAEERITQELKSLLEDKK